MNKINATFNIHTLVEVVTLARSHRVIEVLTTIHENERNAVLHMIGRSDAVDEETKQNMHYVHSFYLDDEWIGDL